MTSRCAAIAALLVTLCACGAEDSSALRRKSKGETLPGEPRHGGQLVIVEKQQTYMEVLHDEAGGTTTVWIYDGRLEPKAVTDAPVMNLTEAAVQVTGDTPDGTDGPSSTWVFRHDALKSHQHGVRFRLTVDGKTYTPDWHAPH